MAFDKTQLRTCKELLKISKIPKYMKSYVNNVFEGKIVVRFGRFYVTNNYALVSVVWDEYQHAGDEEWQELVRFADDEGRLIPFEFKTADVQRANDIFENWFIRQVDFSENLPVNPQLLASVLKVFQINDLCPVMVQDGAKWELSAHNKDVTIRAIVMGIRR